MPVTPFHMGPALLAKAAAPRRFSLVIFGVSQVVIDVEPLVGLFTGAAVLHGFSHTLTGATLIAIASALAGRSLCERVLGLLNGRPTLIGTTAAWSGAFVGTYSHLVLDGMMHYDMKPFAPLTDANPILGAMSVLGIYLFCVVSGVVGGLALQWRLS